MKTWTELFLIILVALACLITVCFAPGYANDLTLDLFVRGAAFVAILFGAFFGLCSLIFFLGTKGWSECYYEIKEHKQSVKDEMSSTRQKYLDRCKKEF